MKLSVFFLAFASVWHSVHGREHEPSFLRGSDVETATAKHAKPAASDEDIPFHERHLGRLPATDSTCATSIVVVMHGRNKTSEELLSCDTADGKSYVVRGVPEHIIQANKKSIIAGAIELSVSGGAYLDEATATLEMPSPQRLKFKEKIRKDGDNSKEGLLFDRSRRSLAVTPVTGTRSALVVRVIASNAAPSKSEATLSNSVFGNGADGTVDPVSMKSHFQTCSHGQLNFVQASDRDGRSIRIRNGELEFFAQSLIPTTQTSITRFLTCYLAPVTHISASPHTRAPSGATTVTVSASATQGNDGAINNAVRAELNAQFGVTNPNVLANHLMFFLPPGVIPGVAYAWVPGDTSVYDDGWCVHLFLSTTGSFI